MQPIFTWQDEETELVCYDQYGRVEKRKIKPKLPDGSFMKVGQHYSAVALHAFRGSYVKKGYDDIAAVLMPNGQISLLWEGCFKEDAKIGKDFNFN